MLKWLAFFVVNLFSIFIGRILAIAVVPFANDEGWLPNWLSWWQTPDNPLDGDGGWINEHWQWRYKLPAFMQTYVGRLGWLWRNNLYGFAIGPLGALITDIKRNVVYGDPLVSNRPLHNGWLIHIIEMQDGTFYWQFYFVKAWNEKRCVRINLGWKLWGNVDKGQRKQFVFSPNPLMGYST